MSVTIMAVQIIITIILEFWHSFLFSGCYSSSPLPRTDSPDSNQNDPAVSSLCPLLVHWNCSPFSSVPQSADFYWVRWGSLPIDFYWVLLIVEVLLLISGREEKVDWIFITQPPSLPRLFGRGMSLYWRPRVCFVALSFSCNSSQVLDNFHLLPFQS